MTIVRLATLADTAAVVDLYRSAKPALPYDAMTLYERWQEGGAWASIETCAVHLNRLLAGSGVPLVAEIDGQVLAEAEVYESFEPAPFGHNLHIAGITTHASHTSDDLAVALLAYITEMARLMKCDRITAADQTARDFYLTHGFRHSRAGRGVHIPTQEGRAFYQATEHTDRNPDQVKGWHMQLGRYQSSRQEWDKLFPQDWAAGIPEVLNIATAHIKLTITGQNAIIFLRETDQVGEVNLAFWSARPLTNPLLSTLRDRVYRAGYHTIVTYVMEADLPLLGADIQQTPYHQELYELAI
ncbi:MAG: GNAT family N-acetyltransferase [Chloroflexota bacterium]